jgi:PAS domain S-box-containing protein
MLHITDAQGKVLYVSPNCGEMTGYTQEEFMETIHWWVHEEDLPKAQELYEQTFREGIGQRAVEYKAVRKNGDTWHASSSWEPFHNQDGLFAGIVIQTVDVTERKRAEQELRKLYEQARQDAEVKAELLREINHRVGNNLTAIAGMLSLERKHLTEGTQDAYHELMQDLTNRINGLARVHDLLSASEWKPLPLEDLLRQVVHSSLQLLPPDRCVTVDIASSPLRVTADQAHHLALIINELATNVVKYALGQRVAARISIHITCEDHVAEITFQDDGSGYPDEVLRQEQYHVGLDLVTQLMLRGLQGNWTLRNDGGAVTVLQFPVQTS